MMTIMLGVATFAHVRSLRRRGLSSRPHWDAMLTVIPSPGVETFDVPKGLTCKALPLMSVPGCQEFELQLFPQFQVWAHYSQGMPVVS